MGFFEEVYDQGQFESSLSATFLALIPKKNDARNIKDFRPISLIGSVYKLLSKVLANRLKEVLDDLISWAVEDGLWWKLKTNGIFDVQSLYSFLRESPTLAFPWKCIWRTKVPWRPCFFVWTAAWQKILTCDNLRKRGYYMTSWCCMCRCNGETVEHLLLHCPIVGGLWNWVFQAFGVRWVISGTVADLLFSRWNGLGRHSLDIWNFVPACLM